MHNDDFCIYSLSAVLYNLRVRSPVADDYNHVSSLLINMSHLNIQVLPADQSLHCSHLQGLQCIINTKTIFAGVLRYLIKIFSDQFLLLDELHISQRFRC